MDKFPEAFKRFEKTTDIEKIDTFIQLLREFRDWSKERWSGSPLQVSALMNQASKMGLVNWKSERITRQNHQIIIHRNIKTGRFVSIRKR